jgi:S1-C subfamily serine protease
MRKPTVSLPTPIVAKAVGANPAVTPGIEPVAAPAAAAAEPSPVPAASVGATGSLEDLVAHISSAVVMIETSTGRGSGVFVRPDTIVTNAHVAGNDVSVRVRRAGGDDIDGARRHRGARF